MDQNEYGDIVQRRWEWLAEQYSYVELDEFVVMPNHVHGIVVIRNNLTSCRDRSSCRRDNPRIVPTDDDSISQNKQFVKSRRHNRLSKTMSAFKTTSSKRIHQFGLSEFVWQRSYHDRIIRSEKQLHAIQMYIRTNPRNWEEDVYYS
jgi:REP element-mobilizing transposase RayT